MNRPAYSLCLCPDSKLLRDRIDTLAATHPPPESGMTAPAGGRQRFLFWGDEGIPPAFWEHLTLQGLFASPKILIIRNAQNLNADSLKQLSAALEPLAGKSGRPEKSGSSGKSTQPSAGASTGSRGNSLVNPLIWPILCFEGPFERGNPKIAPHIKNLPFWQIAEQHGWLEVIPGLTPQSVPAYIRAESARLGITLRAEEVGVLAQGLLPDAALIGSELEKLALLANADGRLPEKTAAASAQTQELGLFDLLRSVEYNKTPHAVWRRILEDRLSGENMVFAFIAVLLREARTLWQVAVGASVYLPAQTAASKKSMAQTMGLARIARIWDLALQADKGIKTGERSPEQAFEILTAELFSLFQHTDGTRR